MNNIEQAKKLLESGDTEQAKTLLLKTVELTQDNVSAWMLLCGIATRTQNWELGASSFGRLVQLRPKSSLATSGLVQSYVNLKRYDEAMSEIERFKLIANPDNEETQIVMDEHSRIADMIEKKYK